MIKKETPGRNNKERELTKTLYAIKNTAPGVTGRTSECSTSSSKFKLWFRLKKSGIEKKSSHFPTGKSFFIKDISWVYYHCFLLATTWKNSADLFKSVWNPKHLFCPINCNCSDIHRSERVLERRIWPAWPPIEFLHLPVAWPQPQLSSRNYSRVLS